ncbi:MAG: signal peptidase I [Bacteroidales bacterium]|nr:signal peptidase I [Bacteroidales bacterium]
MIIIGISIAILEIVALWFVLEKAGEPGWAAIIPIYNYLMVIKIAGKPWWFILLMLIPIVNLVIYIIILNGLSKNFGKDEGFTVGLFFLRFIFLPILGFGQSKYVGDKSNFM